MNITFNIFFLLVFYSTQTFAESATTKEGIIFDAEDASIQRTGTSQKIFLKNNVQVIYQGQHLSADQATIDTEQKTIAAKGNVTLVSTEAKLQSDELRLNYKNNTGEILNGYVQVGQVIFEGKRIIKIGPQEYETFDGRYTACTTCPESWSISGTKVNAEIEGYAYIKNSIIKLSGFPIFWFPYLVVPLKSERQTGLLFPAYAYSKGSGFVISESLFWATNDNTDFTFTMKSYAKRGIKGLVNHRYVLTEKDRGEFNFGFLKDRVFSHSNALINNPEADNDNDPTTKVNLNPEGKTYSRWFLKYNHHYELPYNFLHNMDLNFTGETRYVHDFTDEMEGRGDPALESRVSITKNTDNTHFSIDSSYYQDLLDTYPFTQNKNSVHRFPEINYIASPYRLLDSDLFLNLKANYVNFTRDNFTYDDLDQKINGTPQPRDGDFNSTTDLIRTGQRFDIEPSLNYTIKAGNFFEILPSVSYRESRYNFSIGEKPSTYRRFARTSVGIHSEVSNVFGDLNNPNSTRYKHLIEPEVIYTAIPWIDQPTHPFFGTSAGFNQFNPNFKNDQAINDSDLLQFDYNDRLYDKDLVSFILTNKVIRKRVRYAGAPGDYRQIMSFRLSQSYDFYEAYRADTNGKQPWSELTGLLDVRLDNFETNSLIKYYPYQSTTGSSTRMKLFNDRGDYLQVTYSQDIVINTLGAVREITRTEDLAIGLGLISKYFNFGGETTYNLLDGGSFDSFKYAIKIKPPGNCWGITFSQERPKGKDATFMLNVSFLFDGKTETTVGVL